MPNKNNNNKDKRAIYIGITLGMIFVCFLFINSLTNSRQYKSSEITNFDQVEAISTEVDYTVFEKELNKDNISGVYAEFNDMEYSNMMFFTIKSDLNTLFMVQNPNNDTFKKELLEKGIEVKDKVKVFDIKDFVNKKKDEKMASMFGGSSKKEDFNPFDPTGSKGFDVDEMVRRIDAKIAELEAEEKAEEEKKKQATKIDSKEEIKKEEKPVEISDELTTPNTFFDFIVPTESGKKEAKQTKPTPKKAPTTTIIDKVEEEAKKVEVKEENKEEKQEEKFSDVVIKDVDVTDDQFFDDFFADEE